MQFFQKQNKMSEQFSYEIIQASRQQYEIRKEFEQISKELEEINNKNKDRKETINLINLSEPRVRSPLYDDFTFIKF